MKVFSSRELKQDLRRAKDAALQGPVFISERGRKAHVLLSIEQYEVLLRRARPVTEALAMPGLSEIDFEPKPYDFQIKSADLDER